MWDPRSPVLPLLLYLYVQLSFAWLTFEVNLVPVLLLVIAECGYVLFKHFLASNHWNDGSRLLLISLVAIKWLVGLL